MTDRIKRRTFLETSGTGILLAGQSVRAAAGDSVSIRPTDVASLPTPGIRVEMAWQRRDAPVLSSLMTNLDWCRTYCYAPHVLRTPDGYRMYYIGRTGNSSDLKSLMGFAIGMAVSQDGLTWERFGERPILTFEEVPWGAFALQTPSVLWDPDERRFKLWFIGITEWVRNAGGGTTELTQRLGYATSDDGVRWNVHPEPVFESGRRPCVHREGPGQYRMWMNSRPSRQESYLSLYQNVYDFRSDDGIRWNRSHEPVLRESAQHDQGCIYPCVCRDGERYFLWYGAYPKKEDKSFQIYVAESDDGTHFVNHDSAPAFSNSADRSRFDSFYVSTPCVLVEPDRYLLYYSAVSWAERAKGSYYQHIGVAVCPREV